MSLLRWMIFSLGCLGLVVILPLSWAVLSSLWNGEMVRNFLVVLAICAVVIPVLVWLDPREQAARAEELEKTRAHFLQALSRRPGK